MLALSIVGLLLCSLQVILAEAPLEAKGRRCSTSSSSSSDDSCKWCKKHGPKGPHGNVGPQGYQGLPGAKGEIGLIGSQGEDGPATGNAAFFIVNYDTPLITTTSYQAFPFTYVSFSTSGFDYSNDLTTIILQQAGTYSFSWHIRSSSTIGNYLYFNDTITSQAPSSDSLFGKNQIDVGFLWSQTIITTVNDYTAFNLTIIESEITVEDVSLFIKKLY